MSSQRALLPGILKNSKTQTTRTGIVNQFHST